MGIKHNIPQVRKELSQMTERILDAAEKAGDAEHKLWFEETKLRVPKDTTALAESGKMETAHVRRRSYSWIVGYGNSNTDNVGIDYAAAVHEDLNARHAPPTGAKYVELPLIRAKDHYQRSVARAAKTAVKR